ncbi:hypothetical protein [Ruegeria marina]|uniref:hypothetical protein n=1 Tax=Ruegeria marina TaxID=639004 RepID=UPI0015A1C346|nr:hypothetical protein [Ruegeria marina]
MGDQFGDLFPQVENVEIGGAFTDQPRRTDLVGLFIFRTILAQEMEGVVIGAPLDRSP